ncbi:TylF/MycF/NovP-related O-methyltransferase [Roseomonas sp. AR75]|uniref:TylF/MycF/NovP-related O-methyltransferase n=1 Tax=Roseomonas sp. AR75 TaxID=2562311 RepID=UPI001F101B1D|nr:TylF/MycF/NovP-related O-methyltransferase [Roseomonas sp. AR75]
MVRRALEAAGLVAIPASQWRELRNHRTVRAIHRRDVIEIEELYRSFVFPDLPRDPQRVDILHNLEGTTVGEGVHIVHYLHRALRQPGDVCEFGCNEGATSRLLANEILPHAERRLWLFDSFEGLPAPGEKDRLIDDIAHLGDIARYQGDMRATEEQVRDKLALVPFPPERTRVVKGWIEQTLARPEVPRQVAFAYVDLDFHDPIRLALDFLDRSMQPGGYAVVDDYGFFSEGAQLAVDAFVAAHPSRWRLLMPHPAAGKFCVLERLAAV